MGSLPEYAFKLPHSFAQLARWRLENLARAITDTTATQAEDTAKERLGKLEEPWIKLDELAAAHNFESLVRGSSRILEAGYSRVDMAAVAAVTAIEGDKVDPNYFNELKMLKRTDGSITLVPQAWERMRIGSGPTFLEEARQDPDFGGTAATRPIEYVALLIKHFRPDFDDYPFDKRLELIEETIERIGDFLDSLRKLMVHLEFGEPGRNLSAPVNDPDGAVRAAILHDVHDKTWREVGELLRIEPPPRSDVTGGNRNAENTGKNGREILDARYRHEGGWQQKAQAMKAMAVRLRSRDNLKDEFIELLAQDSGVSFEEAYSAVVEDGFDKTIDEWVEAWEHNDSDRAVRIQLSDPRFNLIGRVLR
jgi:hypothetical protein